MNQQPPNQQKDPADCFLKKPTRFRASGLGEVTLEARTDSRAGGVGCVYFEQGKAFKLYHEPDLAIQQKLPDRLRLLSRLDHECLVGPRGLIEDTSGHFRGYWMNTVQGEEFSRLLTLQFQMAQGYGMDELKKLIEIMREATLSLHGQGAIMGDPNERNYIFRKIPRKGAFPWFLDVDNWGIVNRFGPVALAPHIQDHQHKGQLCHMTDWYGMGILWFWLLTCTHPYAGRLAGFDHRDPEHLIKRMKAQAPVFKSGVKMPPATRALNELPPPFVDWCGRVFEHGERSIPPSMFEVGKIAAAAVTTHMTIGSALFTKVLEQVGDPVIRIFKCGLALTKSGKLMSIESRRQVAQVKSSTCEVVKTDTHYLIGDYADDGSTAFFSVEISSGKQAALTNKFPGDKIWQCDNRLYVISENSISELKLWAMGADPILMAAQTWPLAERTMTWLEEVAVQNIYGRAHVWVPFKEGTYTVLPVKELDGLVPVTSRASGRYVVITAQGRGGQAFKVEIMFSKDYNSCEVKSTASPYLQLNSTILEKGLVAMIEEDGELTLSFPFTPQAKEIKDRYIQNSMQLASTGNKILCIHNDAVWHIKPS